MQLKILSSNSNGNCYILEAINGEVLLIECGVRFDKIKKALRFKLHRVVGCILTHEHGDHAKGINDVMAAGINVWTSAGTHVARLTEQNHRARFTFSGDTFTCGRFKVRAFAVKHDASEPLGFLINHPECGNVLFLTDTYYVEYRFKNLNHVIIEANYSQQIIDDRLAAGFNPKFLRDRILTSHMSLETCKKTLAANDLSAVQNIVLIHLSDGNSDAGQFKTEITELTGKQVHIAEPGLSINFLKQPF